MKEDLNDKIDLNNLIDILNYFVKSKQSDITFDISNFEGDFQELLKILDKSNLKYEIFYLKNHIFLKISK